MIRRPAFHCHNYHQNYFHVRTQKSISDPTSFLGRPKGNFTFFMHDGKPCSCIAGSSLLPSVLTATRHILSNYLWITFFNFRVFHWNPSHFFSCATSFSAFNYYHIQSVAHVCLSPPLPFALQHMKCSYLVWFLISVISFLLKSLLFSYILISYPLNFIFVYRTKNKIFNTFKNFKGAAIEYFNYKWDLRPYHGHP
jgi:hypothetical protein